MVTKIRIKNAASMREMSSEPAYRNTPKMRSKPQITSTQGRTRARKKEII
jgi:hypothetical protein